MSVLAIPNLFQLRQKLFALAAMFISAARLISKISGPANVGILQRLAPGPKLPGDAFGSGFQI